MERGAEPAPVVVAARHPLVQHPSDSNVNINVQYNNQHLYQHSNSNSNSVPFV